MKVALGTIEVSDDDRRAIANHYGEPGLASRETIRAVVRVAFTGVLEDMGYDLKMQTQHAEEADDD